MGQVGIHPSTQPLWHAPAPVCRARLSGPLSFVKDTEIIINYENHSARARVADPRFAEPSSTAAHELSEAHSLPSPKKQHFCLLNGKAVGIFSVLACNLFVLPFAVKSI